MAAPDTDNRQWPQRYHDLLAKAGLDRDAELGVALKGAIKGALQPQEPRQPALMSLAQCLSEPERLTRQIRDDYADAQTARAVTARLSVLQQDLALNIIAPLTLRLFLQGETPLPDPDRIFFTMLPTRTAFDAVDTPPTRWGMTSSGPPVSVPGFVSGMAALANDWYPMFRKVLGISPGAYWSSIGLGLGAPFSVVWNRAEPTALCQLAQAWLKQFECAANRFIDWIPTEFSQQPCAIPQRRGCCLKYLLPDGGYCGTCGIYRKDRIAAARRQPVPSQAAGYWPAPE